MGNKYSNLKWKLKGRICYYEYTLQQECSRADLHIARMIDYKLRNTTSSLTANGIFRGISSYDSISLSINYDLYLPYIRQMSHLSSRITEIECLSLSHLEVKHRKRANACISQIRVNKIKNAYIDAGCTAKVDFKWFQRSLCKLLSRTTEIVKLSGFKISHKDFCRILISCANTQWINFSGCIIEINSLEDLKTATLAIQELIFFETRIIQPIQDTEFHQILAHKLTKSQLSNALRRVSHTRRKRRHAGGFYPPKKTYSMGSINFVIYN
ncbi:unnamed protein product [Moneuplotes crassus]|uniref:Uncharacterized protein n=1 Tax=Euplotes crassus TaxID=5936 RepID=A0AAD1XGA7_EUPCR|nr:unnamed protein product [Moneuplotes crassus]